jgi:hypothetical protein
VPTNTPITALKMATKGLLYMSESDEPFTTFTWKNVGAELTNDKLLALGKHVEGAPVKEVALDDFFKDLTESQEWHGEEEKADVMRYQKLLRVIKDNLSEVRVLKVGQVEVAIYILGRTKTGDWAGVKTKAVET